MASGVRQNAFINGWGTLGEKPHAYTAGTWGPPEATALLARDGFTWVE
jgi:glucose-6-phosphate 1-dehydrogenase